MRVPSPMHERRRLALACAVAAPLAALVAVTIVFGRVPAQRDIDHPSAAALVFRDRVPSYQEYGTAIFSREALARGYAHLELLGQEQPYKTRALLQHLEALLSTYPSVDLFLLTHGNHIVNQLGSLPPDLLQRLRLVYNTGCANGYQGPQWLALGADAYVGHDARSSMSPAFYFFFARQWAKGASLEEAVRRANLAAHRRLSAAGVESVRTRADASLVGRATLWIGENP